MGRSQPDSIRDLYQQHGAEAYYRRFGNDYRNPHEAIIARSLRQAVEQWQLDLADVLDLAAGSGEATLVLRELGATVTAMDPFTADSCSRRTAISCERIGFAEIEAGALAGRRFSLIVCSFAMHLWPPTRLPGLVQQLALASQTMMVITPHKRPLLRPQWGYRLEQEMVVERVRTRLYRAT